MSVTLRVKLKPPPPPVAISWVQSATDTKTHDISVENVLDAIRTGGKKLKDQITQIRNRFEAELAITGDRKAAKLSFSNRQNQKEPLQHLIDRLLASEPTMISHNPPISLASASTRVAEETENVWLEHVFIYVIIREGDGDYHLIIGNGHDTASKTLMNVEIAALPESSSPYYHTLKSVRDKFEHKYSMCSKKNFWEDHKVLPEISIKGTLFFDLRHANTGEHVGNKHIKTQTFWEIHPATYIKFWN